MELTVTIKENNEEVVWPIDYIDINISVKVFNLIQNYTHTINKTAWRV